MKIIYILDGLDCANCANKIERVIQKINGVNNATINFFTGKLIIEIDETKKDELINLIEKAIKKQEPDVKIKRI
ncbi:Cadmium, zinc and cobalt-transporting ATPase [compost metagenome]